MGISITINLDDGETIANAIEKLGSIMGLPCKSTKPKKGQPAAEEEEEIESEVEEAAKEVDADEPDETPAVTKQQVIKACQLHASKNTKEKTIALMQKKFKVKSVHDLDEDSYADALKVFKV